jgi:hypothetical protein
MRVTIDGMLSMIQTIAAEQVAPLRGVVLKGTRINYQVI